jgi:hypothetical protein
MRPVVVSISFRKASAIFVGIVVIGALGFFWLSEKHAPLNRNMSELDKGSVQRTTHLTGRGGRPGTGAREDQGVALPIWIIVSTLGGFLVGWSVRGHYILRVTARTLK